MGDDILDILDDDTSSVPPATDVLAETKAKEEYKPKSNDGKGNGKPGAWDIEYEPLEVKADGLLRFNRMFTVLAHGKPPEEVSLALQSIVAKLMEKGFTYRSGGDVNDVLSVVADKAAVQRTVFMLPWPGFNSSVTATLKKPSEKAYRHGAFYHNKFTTIPGVVRTILARNNHLLLGEECNTPVNLFICYSGDGAETIKDTNYATTGNISYPIKVCESLDIPVFNLKNANAKERILEFLETLT